MTSPSPIAWWKPTPDTLAAYLTLDQSKRLLAGATVQAPKEWQRHARVTLGERLGQALGALARTTLSVGSLGLSEIVYRLAQPGQLAASPNLPPLDIVVGPFEAAVLIVDGAVSEVLTADRAQTHDFWEKLQRTLARGPHLEVVMLDLAPSLLAIPFALEIGAEEVPAQVDAEVGFDRNRLQLVLQLLSRIRTLQQSDLNAQSADSPAASFASTTALAQSLQRRLQAKSAAFECVRQPSRTLRTDGAALLAAQSEVARFLNDELQGFGLAVQRCHLLVGRSAAEDLEIRRRSAEIAQQQQALEAQTEIVELRRQQELAKERQQIAVEQGLDRLTGEARLKQLGESQRFALARMIHQNENELAVLQREGFAKQRESERIQEQLDANQRQMLAAQAHTAQLERDLSSARNDLEVQRLRMQIETERLKIAALAQEQNLMNLRRIKEIEREDALLRQREAAELEKARLAAAGALTPEQMLAAMADRSPEIAKALAAKFAADGALAQRSAAEKVELMQKMQADMAAVMREGLSANAQVARGLVMGAAGAPAATAECRTCHGRVQPQWKACPHCGNPL